MHEHCDPHQKSDLVSRASDDLFKHRQARKRKKRWRSWIFGILVLLIVIRLILPFVVLKYVNKSLSEMEGYYGHVEDIDLHLYRGAYVIKDIRILKKLENKKKGAQDTIPFFSSPRMDLSVEWKALLDGAIVGEIELDEPRVNFVKAADNAQDVASDTADFKQLVRELMPLTINRFQVNNGSIHFMDPFADPGIDLALSEIQMTAVNLINTSDSDKKLPASLTASARAYGGSFQLNSALDGVADVPTFDLSADLKGLNLVELNPFLRRYAKFDVEKGHFSLVCEFAAKEGNLGGYVKPSVSEIKVVKYTKEEGDLAQIAYESLISAAAFTVKNKSTGEIASRIPIEGKINDPQVNTLYSIGYVLRNGFLRALHPTLEGSISINDLEAAKDKTVLERVFGGRDKEDSKKKRKRKDKR